MKNKFTLIYTFFAAIIFVFAISFLSVNIYKEYKYGPERTSTVFNTILSEIRTKSKTSNPKDVVLYLNKQFDNYNDFSYIKISFNDVEMLKYPSNISDDNITTPSKFSKKYKSSVGTEDGTYYIDCDLYVLRPYSIFYYSKVAFLIILITTIVTIIQIIYLNMTSDESSSSIHEIENDVEPELNSISNEPVITEEPVLSGETTESTNNSTASDITEKTTSFNNDESAKIETTVPSETTGEISTADDPEEKINETTTEVEKVALPSEEVKPSELNNSENQNIQNEEIIDSQTGFGKEKFLITRLDNEINRAIASEIDLSLFLIKLNDIDKNSETFKNICNYLAIQFQFKDLIFLYDEDCIAAMKITMDIDEALTLADKLYLDIKNLIQDKECYIGISSRSIRMVSGERLLHEASQAVIHALEDKESPIIAFRVDAEKYRQFLEQNN